MNSKNRFIKITFTLIIILCFFNQVDAQRANSKETKCEEVKFPFVGVPEKSLCEDFGEISFDLFVGIGSPQNITNSSQITPSPTQEIHIVGDFIIDNNFTLFNTII